MLTRMGRRRTRSSHIDSDIPVATASPALTALKNSQLMPPRPDETQAM
jgi:hypothetical protein